MTTFKKEGDHAAAAALFKNYQTRKSSLVMNPPMPRMVHQGWSSGNKPGFIMPDPMAVTSYQNPSGDTPAEPTPNDSPDTTEAGVDPYSATGQMMYGFRFLMNQETHTEMWSSTQGVDPMQMQKSLAQDGPNLLPPVTGSGATFTLLISRRDDLRILGLPRERWEDQYEPTLSEEDRKQILTRGTNYDLEFLFRTVNIMRVPVWWDTTTGGSSDFGFLLPRPVTVAFGDELDSRRLRGFISNLNVQHLIMAPGMIPALSKYTIRFERMHDATAKPVDYENEDLLDVAVNTAVNTLTGAVTNSPLGIGLKAAQTGFRILGSLW